MRTYQLTVAGELVSDLGRTLLEVRVGDEDAKRRGRARAEAR